MKQLLVIITMLGISLGLEKQVYIYQNHQYNVTNQALEKSAHPDQDKIDYYNSLKPHYVQGQIGNNHNRENPQFNIEGSRATVEVYFCTDSWGTESSWNVYDSNGNGYYDGIYGAGWIGNNSCYSEYLELGTDNYTIVLYDSYGDGGLSAGVFDPGVGTYVEMFGGFNFSYEDSRAFGSHIECGSLASITLEVGGGSWGSEVSWNLSNGSSGGTGFFELCLENGEYTFNGFDSYGDGWNGNTANFTDSDGNLISSFAVEGSSGSWTFTIGGPPPVAGCMDDSAENFNPEATMNDGSCTWNGGCSAISYTSCASGDQCVPVNYWCDGSSEWGNAGWGPDCLDGSDENFDECCNSGDYADALCNPPAFCEDDTACNYGFEGSCEFPSTGLNCDGSIADGYFSDCVGTVTPESYLSWIGDGYCDDGAWGLVFTCCDFNMDNGDCGDSIGCDDVATNCGGASIDDCDICDNDSSNDCQPLSISYEFGQDITGFQFNISGVSIIDNSIYGGVSEEYFDLISSNSTTVIGVSFSNTPIPIGEGILTNLMVAGNPQNATLENVTLTDTNVQEVESTTDGLTIIVDCIDVDNDGICFADDINDNDNCYANFYDCSGICGGDAIVDDCGVCGGDGISGCPDEFSFVQSTTQVFYEIISATFNGQPLTENDLIAIYSNGECTGFTAWETDGSGTVLAGNGNDGVTVGTQNYFNPGDSPQFVIYIANEDALYPAGFAGCVDQFLDQSECTFANLAYYQVGNLYAGAGCSDPAADNYNPYVLTDDGSCIYNFNLSLVEGNNLVSFPGIPEGMPTTELLDMIPGVNFIITNRMILFKDGDEWLGNLNTVNEYTGYWVNVSSSIDLPVLFPNISMDHCHSYTLEYGNNLVAFYGFEGDHTLQSLGCDPLGSTNLCENFWFVVGDAVGLFNSYYSEGCDENFCWSGNLNNLYAQKGYWIYLDEFDYPYHEGLEYYFNWNMGSDCDVPSVSNLTKSERLTNPIGNLPEEFRFIQSTQQAFYMIKEIDLNEKLLDSQDLIIAEINGEIVGSAFWDENYTILPIMGADHTPGTENYTKKGDKPIFKLYKSSENVFYPLDGNIQSWNNLGIYTLDKLTQKEPINQPLDFALQNPFPNPFNGHTVINFTIPEKNNVVLDVYDLHGQHIISLENSILEAGFYTNTWNSENFGSGVYFIRLTIGNLMKSQKIVLMK